MSVATASLHSIAYKKYITIRFDLQECTIVRPRQVDQYDRRRKEQGLTLQARFQAMFEDNLLTTLRRLDQCGLMVHRGVKEQARHVSSLFQYFALRPTLTKSARASARRMLRRVIYIYALNRRFGTHRQPPLNDFVCFPWSSSLKPRPYGQKASNKHGISTFYHGKPTSKQCCSSGGSSFCIYIS